MAVASSQGGMDIEAVAANTPEAIVTTPIDVTVGFTNESAMEVAGKIGFEGESQAKAAKEMTALYNLFLEVRPSFLPTLALLCCAPVTGAAGGLPRRLLCTHLCPASPPSARLHACGDQPHGAGCQRRRQVPRRQAQL